MKERESSHKKNIQERVERENCKMKGPRKKFKQERHKKKVHESLVFLALSVSVVCNDGGCYFH